MGCGVSSGTQISPVNSELPTMELKNGATHSAGYVKDNSSQLRSAVLNAHSSTARSRANFHIGLLFPCRFYGTNSTSLSNVDLSKKQCTSTEMQTESDILGFKCQHSQTDSQILNDQELEAMIEQLNLKLKNVQEDCKVIYNADNNELDDEENELLLGQRSWKGIIKAHKDEFESDKKYINTAVQATRPKVSSATQTKYGSIDHQFVPNSHIPFLEMPTKFFDHNELLTKTISENLLKVIEQPSLDQHLTTLLTSFDDDDDNISSQLSDSESDKMINSIQRTLASYGSKEKLFESVELSNANQTKELLPNEVADQSEQPNDVVTTAHSIADKAPVLHDTKIRLKDVQKKLRFLKQQKFHDCLELIMNDIKTKKNIEDFLPISGTTVKKRDVSLQTTNDILTDEAPQYAARPPLCHKNEMIPSVLMFREIDRKMLDTSQFSTLQEIGEFVCKHAKNDLFKIRALFMWVTSNIRYNIELDNTNMISSEILAAREGVSKHYCQLFGDLCRWVGIRVKQLEGFARNYDFRPGYHFQPGRDAMHYWNAVFVLSSWRFIDLTLAAGTTDPSGQFKPNLNEHYFLTDPNLMIWSHFPYNELEADYERWQLLDKPLTIEEFNSQPKVTEYFFEYNLSIRSKIQSPLQFRISTEIKVGSHEAMRYKYKFYPANDKTENASLNRYVFCQLKEDRLVGSFMVSPPFEGRFMLKVYAKTEREMQGSQQDINASLNLVIIMLLECTKARKYIQPLPLCELPWGPTQKFYDYKLKLINQKGPTIVTWGGRRRLILEANETMELRYSLFDEDSIEMDPRSFVSREDVGLKTTFTINPPQVGTFKFILLGMPKPKQKGKYNLPILAMFMIDCKLTKPLQQDEDVMITSSAPSDDGKKQVKGKK